MRRSTRKWLVGAVSVGLLGLPVATGASAYVAPDGSVFISEIHYDDEGTDSGEAVEVFGPAGTDLTGWSIVRYNGSNGTVYTSPAETVPLPAGIPDIGASGFGVAVVEYTVNGLQNGAPDGVALVDAGGAVRQFLSYEGTFLAVGGAADGLTSTDIGVVEESATPDGSSIHLAGTGVCYGDLVWAGPAANSFGAFGTITPTSVGPCIEDDPGGGGGGDELPPVRISEIHYDNDGGDINEAVEIFGPAGTDLTGWSVVRYNGNGGAPYTSPGETVALPATIPDLGGGVGVAVVQYAANGLQNGAPDAVALVDGTGALIEFLSYEGVMVGAGGPADGVTSTDIGVEEGSATLATQSLQRDIAGVWGGPFCASFGEVNAVTPDVLCPLPPMEVKIHEVQGSTDVSPLVGQRVIVEGVVVGDEEGPAPALRGFFVQEEDADVDGDPATSEGVFVFNFDNDSVDLGDVVSVEGTVEERFGNTQLTDFVVVKQVDVRCGGHTGDRELPGSVGRATSRRSRAWRRTFPQNLVISEYFNYDRFGEIVVALPADGESRPYTPTALYAPDDPQAAGSRRSQPAEPHHGRRRQFVPEPERSDPPDQPRAVLARERLPRRRPGQRSRRAGLLQLRPLSRAAVRRRRVRRPTTKTDEHPIARRRRRRCHRCHAEHVELLPHTRRWRERRVWPDQNQECRGADDAGEFDRQRVKLLNTLEGLDADVVGLVEIENRPGVEPLADVVAGLNDRLGAGTYDYVVAGDNSVVGTDAIKVGLIYKPGSVTPIGDVAVLDTPEFLDPNNTGSPKNRAAVASSFIDNASGEVFSVVVNHLKSKGSGCGDGDDDPLAGSCNLTRTLVGSDLADWLATNPTGVDDSDWLIVGDLNSYDKEDPIAALRGRRVHRPHRRVPG